MIENIFTIISALLVFILGFATKRFLYANQHEASIQKELNTFNDNFDVVANMNMENDFKLGSGHLYSDR